MKIEDLHRDVVEALCGRFNCSKSELAGRINGKTPHDLAKEVAAWELGDGVWFNVVKSWGVNLGAIVQADGAFDPIRIEEISPKSGA